MVDCPTREFGQNGWDRSKLIVIVSLPSSRTPRADWALDQTILTERRSAAAHALETQDVALWIFNLAYRIITDRSLALLRYMQ
jgi:hypothetical protein